MTLNYLAGVAGFLIYVIENPQPGTITWILANIAAMVDIFFKLKAVHRLIIAPAQFSLICFSEAQELKLKVKTQCLTHN